MSIRWVCNCPEGKMWEADMKYCPYCHTIRGDRILPLRPGPYEPVPYRGTPPPQHCDICYEPLEEFRSKRFAWKTCKRCKRKEGYRQENPILKKERMTRWLGKKRIEAEKVKAINWGECACDFLKGVLKVNPKCREHSLTNK